jgi:hypothetical protein
MWICAICFSFFYYFFLSVASFFPCFSPHLNKFHEYISKLVEFVATLIFGHYIHQSYSISISPNFKLVPVLARGLYRLYLLLLAERVAWYTGQPSHGMTPLGLSSAGKEPRISVGFVVPLSSHFKHITMSRGQIPTLTHGAIPVIKI